MKYRTLGKDLRVSAVGLGCMGMSHAYGAPADRKEMRELIAKAVDIGYTMFDTAEVYGTPENPHAVCPLTAVQNRYSMMARHYEPLFPVLEELSIGLVAFSPMANGFLTGRYGKDSKFDTKTDYRSIMPQFTAEGMDKNRELLALLEKTAEEKGATSGQVSLAWMIEKKPFIVPIPGTRKFSRLKENAGAAEISLTAEEVQAIDSALDGMEMSEVFGGSAVKSR